MFHGRIVTNSLRARRGLTKNASCKRCGAVDESILHVLRDCFLAKHVWDEMVPLNCRNLFYSMLEGDWLVSNILYAKEFSLGNDLNWTTFSVLACWWLWRWRNGFVFQDKIPTGQPVGFIFS